MSLASSSPESVPGASSPSLREPLMPQSIIVFSHLRWDFVFQRPQHLLTRLAKHYRVFFFEEPVAGSSYQQLQISEPAPNLRVCRPRSTIASPGFHDDQIPFLQQMLMELMEQEQIHDYSVWFYSPMALPLMQDLNPNVVVYDCMDELAAFRSAPRQLLQRESALLKIADIVFTGGPSLYRAKRGRHPSVHCFPSSVDASHFGRARGCVDDHPLQRELPWPRLGYFGVIDERLDLELIGALAQARPQWQIAMVGPHAKVNPATLPRRSNIHYFGQQPYQDLPRFVAGWDVCLQPFALNEATRFISPTKTLEYMAAERPIVSTPITDVVEPYGDVVYIAKGPADFIAACDRALHADTAERQRRIAGMRAALAHTSWDRTAEEMRRLLADATRSHETAPATLPLLRFKPPQVMPAKAVEAADAVTEDAAVDTRREAGEYPAIVIGAGPTGLSAAYHLGKGSLLLEQRSTVGG